MFFRTRQLYPHRLAALIVLIGCVLGIGIGLLSVINPVLIAPIFVVMALVGCFFWRFEQTLLFLLIIRSALDPFSPQGIPSLFAIGLIALVAIHLTFKVLTRQPIQFDRFWCFFAGWVALQGMWLILLPLGGLGFGGGFLVTSLREWIRIFSWVVVYFAVLQLRGKVPPGKIINLLLLSLILPLIAAFLQVVLPASALPSFLAPASKAFTELEGASRVNGTLGLANTFASFLVLFTGLAYWKLRQSNYHFRWWLLLGILIFFITATKTLVGLMMVSVLMLVIFAPGMKLLNVILGAVAIAVMFVLFSSTEFGGERLASVLKTPLLNPHMDISRAILLSWTDHNSFNWRLAQWNYLLGAWKQSPILGYGLASAPLLGSIRSAAHNDYVRALVETGIVGFCTFCSFLIFQMAWLLRSYFSNAKNSDCRRLCLVLLANLCAIMVGMITENIWSHTTMFAYWFILLSLTNWDWDDSGHESRVAQP